MPEFCYDCPFIEICDPEHNDFMVMQCEADDARAIEDGVRYE